MDRETKDCVQCGESKSASEFYVNKRDGVLLPRCKPCHNAYTLARYYAKRADLPSKLPRTGKRCTRCSETKPLTEFGTKGKNHWRAVCRQCRPAELAEDRAAKPELKKAQDAAYRERHAAELAERQREWRLAHPEEYTAIHSKWKSGNKDAVNASTHKRRSTINGAGSFTAAEWAALKEQYDHRCLMCGLQEPEIRLTVDHIVPLSKGGMNIIDNIQPLCKSCNSKKHRGIIDLRAAWRAAD